MLSAGGAARALVHFAQQVRRGVLSAQKSEWELDLRELSLQGLSLQELSALESERGLLEER